MSPRSFVDHPKFPLVSRLVSEAMIGVARELGCERTLDNLETHANRVADDLAKLILRAYDQTPPAP